MSDFDYWKELNENDPKRFEQERTDMLNKEIAKASPTQMLRIQALQARINLDRRNASSPMQSCIIISNMMWAEFDDLNQELQSL